MKIYLIAKTEIEDGFNEYLSDIKQNEWMFNILTDSSDLLVEFAGRLCYKSWAPYDGTSGTNPNVKKVRTGNKKYIKNILSSGHGSVLEHVNLTFLCTGVSRVFTHELVRHRAGCAYSQESLRYCRLEHMEVILPDIDEQSGMLYAKEAIEKLKVEIGHLNTLLIKDDMPFFKKKELTSWIRRICPIGISTNILFTANVRALRHMIALRTSSSAEVEIREVFTKIAHLCKEAAPNLFQDIMFLPSGSIDFQHRKV